jgi:hypothetical protein
MNGDGQGGQSGDNAVIAVALHGVIHGFAFSVCLEINAVKAGIGAQHLHADFIGQTRRQLAALTDPALVYALFAIARRLHKTDFAILHLNFTHTQRTRYINPLVLKQIHIQPVFARDHNGRLVAKIRIPPIVTVKETQQNQCRQKNQHITWDHAMF